MQKNTKIMGVVLALFITHRICLGMNPTIPNFSPLAALAFCGCAWFGMRAGTLLPMAALLLSSMVLNVHYGMSILAPYDILGCVGLAATGLIGHSFRGKSPTGIIGGSILATLAFYLITNSGAWLANPAYTKSLAGWVQALTSGQPGYPPTWMFLRNSLVADLILTVGWLMAAHSVTAAKPFQIKI